MKVAVFGTGLFYRNRKKDFPVDVEILVFFDNNEGLWGKTLDGKEIVDPKKVNNYLFDRIVLMSKSAGEMKRQLMALNVDAEKIITWNQFMCESARGKFHFFCGNERRGSKGRILILSTPLSYSGAPVTAVYAAKALQMKGYDVVLCAKDGDPRFIEETVNDKINIVLCQGIPYLGREELFWIRQFDMALVNTFLMMPCAYEISRFMPTVWWIHECSADFERYFPDTMEEFSEYADKVMLSQMEVLGVSSIAKANFNQYFPNSAQKTLSYGIPDHGRTGGSESCGAEKMVFAVVGSICRRKGQKEFLEAVGKMDEKVRKAAEFWIIGKDVDKEYTKEIIGVSKQWGAVKMKGELSRKEMKEIYEKIDVIVCPSLEETMSIVLTEGMMQGKICITTDKTGMAGYITAGRNGLVCQAGNCVDLCGCMEWVAENRLKLEEMKRNARETYERYFTMERFADQLEDAMLSAKEKYSGKKLDGEETDAAQ